MASTKPRKRNLEPARRVHYVLSTHWDREWLQTFQVFRHRLVRLLDRTLADVKSGKLHGPFTSDGQAIVIDDYLEIRPEKRAMVEEMARAGTLKVGPWYVLPDEWIVSGESIVRNLRLGRSIARSLGGVPSNAGFVCDLFGHIGQLPQIFSGFGIKAALLWRGLEPRSSAHFLWEGSDGTRLTCFRFGRVGYCDYAFNVRRSQQPDVEFDAERSLKDHVSFIENEAKRSGVPPILVFDGGDHLEYDAQNYEVLFSLKPSEKFPYEIVHSTLDQYLEEMLSHGTLITEVVAGELREVAMLPGIDDQQWMIPGVVSSRVWIKQANAACQSLLCHWAEPFGSLAHSYAGADDPSGFLGVAWRWLLMNHPHDSICGCSIDQVHEDMKYRFSQCRQIAERMASEALRSLAASVGGDVGPKELRVLVANPLTRSIDEVVDLTLQVPTDWQCFQEFFFFEAKPAFRVYDASGAEVAYQRLSQDSARTKMRSSRPTKFPQPYKTNDVTVALRLSLPPLGYTTLTVREGPVSAKDEIVPEAVLPTRHPEVPGLATSERSMENEFLGVVVESNGSLTVTDKRSGQSYARLLTFEDIADIGDGWYHGQAVNDQAYVSTACRSDVALVHNGPLLARFRIRTTMRLPAEFQFDRMVRSESLADLSLDSLVTLRRGCDRIEVKTTVANTVKDHRLRVLLPSGARVTTYLSDGAFDVVERPIALPKDNHLARELAVETRPQQSWTAVADAKRGLAVVADGLLECAVRDLPERPIALTLLRSTRRTVMTDGEPEGQLQGTHSFGYWIVPVVGLVERTKLFEYGVQLAAGLRTAQMSAWEIASYRKKAALPATASFLSVSGGAVVTSVRDVEGALEVRLFNPGSKEATARLDLSGRPGGSPKTARRVDFESQPVGPAIALAEGLLRLPLGPKEIATVRLERGKA